MLGQFLCQFEKIERAVGAARETAVLEIDLVGLRAENDRCEALALGDHLDRADGKHRRRMTHGAA